MSTSTYHLYYYSLQIQDTYISVGAGITINGLIDTLLNNQDKSVSFKSLADHLKKVMLPYYYEFILTV